jgi:hypothetical protein
MKDLFALNPKTGKQEPCGTIAEKRTIGDTPVWLTYEETSHTWWIVWQEDNVLRKIGYLLDRREDCWETFRTMTAMDIAKLRVS